MILATRELMSRQQKQHYIAVEDAAKEMGVNRSTMYYYLKQLSIKTKRFKLDRHSYIALSDLERIKQAKADAANRRH